MCFLWKSHCKWSCMLMNGRLHGSTTYTDLLEHPRFSSFLGYTAQTPSAGITHFYHIVMVWVKLAQKPFKQVGMFHFSYCQHKKSFMLCHWLPSSTNVQKYHCHSGQKKCHSFFRGRKWPWFLVIIKMNVCMYVLDSQSCTVLCKLHHYSKSSQYRVYMSSADGQRCQLM